LQHGFSLLLWRKTVILAIFELNSKECIVMFLGILLLTSALGAQSGSKSVATVHGEAISEDQVTKAAASDLAKLDAKSPKPDDKTAARQRLEVMWNALNSIIEDKLLGLEAARDQVTKEQLLEIEVNSNVGIPSEQEVEQFYQANKSQIPIPHDQAIPQVRQYMIDRVRESFRDQLMSRLRKEWGVTTSLDPLRTEVATTGFPSRGPANAPVTILEFADFECPHCGGLFPTLKLVEKNYPDKVRFVYRNFPLTNSHPHAAKAAEASLCANDQHKFWEYHDSLFTGQDHLEIADLKRRAVDLKLDTAAFNTCLDSGKFADAVKKDVADGSQVGVTGTPAMFINGRMLGGNQPYADIREVIEDELQRAKAGK
jgi:predicted DsbA family dithiol-disulfide isomerase